MVSHNLKKVVIIKLFGMFNHVINVKNNENMVIIHGPNGVGKTTILKMIKNFYSINFHNLMSYQFEEFNLEFEDDKFVSIKKVQMKEKFELQVATNIGPKKSFKVADFHKDIARNIPIHLFDDYIPQLERIASDKWIDRSNNEILGISEIFYKYGNQMPFLDKEMKNSRSIPKDFIQYIKEYPVHIIETQRLFVNPDYNEIRHKKKMGRDSTIDKYSSEMCQIMKEIFRESGSVSASQDRTFPHRLLTQSINNDIDEDYIRNKYLEQNEYRNRLMESGLIESEESVQLPDRKLDKNDLKVLYHYLYDVDEKFGVYNDVLRKIELFKDIINSRFLYKKFDVDKNSGFVFTSEISREIPLMTLSSGEQHELVLAFELIFKVPQNSLILIDEPELSLHVTWQHKFLDDLSRISEINNMNFIIATHSPSIVQNRRSLMVTIPDEVSND
jgi:predicted ATP-binding protein involved in virulence